MISCCAVGVYSGPDRKAKQADKGWKPGLNNTDKYQGKDRSERRNFESVCWRSYQFLLSALSRAVQSWQEQQIHSTLIRLYCLPSRTAGNFGLQEMLSGLNSAYQQATISPVQSAAEQQIRSLSSHERTVQFTILSVRTYL